MVIPFATRPWTISYLPVDNCARPVYEFLDLVCGKPADTLVVVAEYFGRALSDEAGHHVSSLQSAGAAVVEDRTHDVFNVAPSKANFVIASLRKLLPVGDGGLLIGAREFEINNRKNGPGDTYWKAMDLKSQAVTPDDLSATTHLFGEAERDFETELEPRYATMRTQQALNNFNYEHFVQARRDNALTLMRLIPDAEVVNSDWATAPSHLVIRVPDPREIQTELAKRRVYCPIHWPRPSQVPLDLPWIEGLLSLPIDHRYDADDMAYIAQALEDVGGGVA